MKPSNRLNEPSVQTFSFSHWVPWLIAGGATLFTTLVAGVLFATHSANIVTQLITSILALDSPQITWYITRAAGIIAYLLFWLSTAWGLAVSSKILDRLLHRSFTYDFHQFLSLFAIGFIALHIFILTGDKFLPYSLAQILVPFISPYRPVWVGIGVISLYLTLLVTVTFYLRNKIGAKTFRSIHTLSLVAYLTGTVHGIFAGTDSSLLPAMIMYIGTFLITVFLMVYWFAILIQKRLKKPAPQAVQKAPTRGR